MHECARLMDLLSPLGHFRSTFTLFTSSRSPFPLLSPPPLEDDAEQMTETSQFTYFNSPNHHIISEKIVITNFYLLFPKELRNTKVPFEESFTLVKTQKLFKKTPRHKKISLMKPEISLKTKSE